MHGGTVMFNNCTQVVGSINGQPVLLRLGSSGTLLLDITGSASGTYNAAELLANKDTDTSVKSFILRNKDKLFNQ
jgi:hypothetical protein